MPSDEELDEKYQALKKLVTNPEFQRVLAEIRSLPPIERLRAAFTQLTVQAFVVRGIPTPVGLTISISASQEDSVGPRASTADVAAAGQNPIGGPVLQLKAVFWVFDLHWSTFLIPPPLEPIPY